MRKTSYFAMSLLLTGLNAQAADLLGVAPAADVPRVSLESTTIVDTAGSANSRDAAVNPGIPVSPPLQSAAPTAPPSVSTTTDATGSASAGTAAAKPKMQGSAGTTTTATYTAPPGAESDNTRIRDRNSQTLTPADQTNTRADIYTTSAIRQALVKSNLSTTARNIKIVTTNGRVTLTGPVKTQADKAKIESVARVAAGAVTVDSQLNVKATTH